MASMRDIKRKISSISSTRHITKAMYLVSSSKLQRARQKLMAGRPYYQQSRRVIANIVGGSKGVSHRYLDQREVKNSLVILIAGDRGLCGGYNANVSRLAYELVKSKENVSVFTIGSRSRDFMKRRRVNITDSVTGISENPFYYDASEIGETIMEKYEKGEIDEIYLAYTEFKSTMTHSPKVIKLLPVDTSEFEDKSKDTETEDDKKEAANLMIFEPSEDEILDYVIPKYINTVLYGALTESAACEQGARMTSMDSATKNAEQMIADYTVLYNRARQGAITQEIIEIVGGADALK